MKLMAYDMIFGIEWDKAAFDRVKGGEALRLVTPGIAVYIVFPRKCAGVSAVYFLPAAGLSSEALCAMLLTGGLAVGCVPTYLCRGEACKRSENSVRPGPPI